jgi:hypothetical protein
MNCCSNCFSESTIKDNLKIKTKNKRIGTCDFCGSKNIELTDLRENEFLRRNFRDLLNIYTPISNSVSNTVEKNQLRSIKNVLFNDWNIFNKKIKSEQIYNFLIDLLKEDYEAQPNLFDEPVVILQSLDNDFVDRNSMLKDCQWEDFTEEIKTHNRFHINSIQIENLSSLLELAKKTYKKKEKEFYRARVWTDKKGYRKNEMGAPPREKALGGRANPDGINYLYLSDSPETTFHEIRAGSYDYVTVGTFELKEDIKLIDLNNIDKISPFIFGDEIEQLSKYALNLPHLKKLSVDISTPLRSFDSHLDYLPTQYICEFIKSENYDGIEYLSSRNSEGINYAIFDEKVFQCIKIKDYDIGKIHYSGNKFLKNRE